MMLEIGYRDSIVYAEVKKFIGYAPLKQKAALNNPKYQV